MCRGDRYVQVVSYLEILRLQGHGVISPLSPRHGAAHFLYSIARTFKICKDNCKIEGCAFLSGFWEDVFYQTSQLFKGCIHPSVDLQLAEGTFLQENSSMWWWRLLSLVKLHRSSGQVRTGGFSGSVLIPSRVTRNSTTILLLQPRDTHSGLRPQQ